MKRETLVIAIALTSLAIITAICAHATTIAQKDAKIAEIQRIADAEINRLQYAVDGLQRSLAPKSYTNPLKEIWISSGTGYRTDPMGGSEYERLHKGVDIIGQFGDPVYAMLAGEVMEHWLPPDGGQWKGHPILGGMITLGHEKFFTIFGHLSETYVHEGEWVEEGQLIGRIGDTGISTGPHLHLEVVIDPLQYLAER